MTENSPEYINEDAVSGDKKRFTSSRAFKISAITVASALALAGSFGAGVLAGQKLGGNQFNDAFGNHQFGNGHFPDGKDFGPGNGFGPGQGFGPGANDPDHGAGTDRPDSQFNLPSAAPTPTSGAKS